MALKSAWPSSNICGADSSDSARSFSPPDSRILLRRIPRLISAMRAAFSYFSKYVGTSDNSVRSISSLVAADLWSSYSERTRAIVSNALIYLSWKRCGGHHSATCFRNIERSTFPARLRPGNGSFSIPREIWFSIFSGTGGSPAAPLKAPRRPHKSCGTGFPSIPSSPC